MLDNYRDLIDELTETPTTLRALFANRPAGTTPPAVPALVAELRDRDQLVYQRLQTLLHQAHPHLHDIPPVAPSAAAVTAADLPALLDAFDAARGDLVSILMNLTLKDWERTATQDVAGTITLADEVERHVEFDEAHVARITEAIGDRR